MRAVILDMDGLMLDTEPLYRASWPGACAELGFVLDDAGYEPMIGRPNDACEAQLVERFGGDFPMARFRVRWPELWKAYARERGIQGLCDERPGGAWEAGAGSVFGSRAAVGRRGW
jgi:beta-phosphoglucomutase-like phosphatase (HAD superfamily)